MPTQSDLNFFFFLRDKAQFPRKKKKRKRKKKYLRLIKILNLTMIKKHFKSWGFISLHMTKIITSQNKHREREGERDVLGFIYINLSNDQHQPRRYRRWRWCRRRSLRRYIAGSNSGGGSGIGLV